MEVRGKYGRGRKQGIDKEDDRGRIWESINEERPDVWNYISDYCESDYTFIFWQAMLQLRRWHSTVEAQNRFFSFWDDICSTAEHTAIFWPNKAYQLAAHLLLTRNGPITVF